MILAVVVVVVSTLSHTLDIMIVIIISVYLKNVVLIVFYSHRLLRYYLQLGRLLMSSMWYASVSHKSREGS